MISIITPVFNREKYLSATIESVLAQTYNNYEFILIDDGSVDSSVEIIKKYRNEYPTKIKLITQPNSGPSGARNNGITQSGGKYIAFLDSDDLWAKDKLEEQIKLFEYHKNIGFTYTGYYLIDEDGTILKKCYPDLKFAGQLYEKLWLINNNIFGGTIMAERKKIIEVGMFDKNIYGAENLDLRIKLASVGNVYFSNKLLSYYRRHKSNITLGTSMMAKNRFKLINKHFGFNGEKNKYLWRKALANLWYSLGVHKFGEMELKEARAYFFKSISYDKSKMDNYIKILRCLLGKKGNSFIKIIKKSCYPS